MRKLIALLIFVVLLTGCTTAAPTSSPTPTKPAAPVTQEVRGYTAAVNAELDRLYAAFEKTEAGAKAIADNRAAPYNAAIGAMAQVRSSLDAISAMPVPAGADPIRKAAVGKLFNLKADLDVIANRTADTVKLTDPGEYYIAYLQVLIEIPELKQEISALLR